MDTAENAFWKDAFLAALGGWLANKNAAYHAHEATSRIAVELAVAVADASVERFRQRLGKEQ
jgi:hypothetical protein